VSIHRHPRHALKAPLPPIDDHLSVSRQGAFFSLTARLDPAVKAAAWAHLDFANLARRRFRR
jgi:hypothetical protein